MSRFTIDCRDVPSDTRCSVTMSADSKEELLDAAVQHAITVHGHQPSPDLRLQLSMVVVESLAA